MTRRLVRLIPAAVAALVFVLIAAGHAWASEASPTPPEAPVKTLPGVDARNLIAAFSRHGYSCQEVSPPRPGWRSFYCVSLDEGAGVPTQTVGFEGPGRQIAYVEACAFGTSPQVAMAFLDSVIDLTVNEQARNAEAHEWEHASIDQQGTETQIGGVHMAMLQSPDPYPTPLRRLILTPS